MLDSLRNAARSWMAKLLLVLLGLSFVAWGVGDVFRSGIVGNSVLTAGDVSVSPIEYRLAYNRQLQIYSQQLNQRLSREQAAALGIDQQVLAQLTAGVVLDEQSRKMRLGLSEDRLASLTAEDPAFRDASGKFSRVNFDGVLRNVGMRPEDYLKSREQVAIRQQVVEALTDGVTAPDVYLQALAVHGGESRDVEFLVLPVSLVQPVAEPSEAELSTFFEERKDSYKAPEYRKFSYVKLTPEDTSNPAAIDDAAVKADYDASIQRYTKKETRRIEQIVFASRTDGDAAKAKITAGATFDDIVAAEKKTLADVALGDLQKQDLPDQKIADAAFALSAGQVSDVIDGQFGSVLVRVTAVTPQTIAGFDEVKAEIRNNMALTEANAVLLEVHDAYEDARGGGDTIEAAAAKTKLKLVTIDGADATGQSIDGKPVKDLPETASLLTAVFAAEQGIENAPINVGSNGFLWYEVLQITPERERPMSEVKDTVVSDWKVAKAAELLAAKAAEVTKQAAGGKSLDDIASELKLTTDTKRGLKRDVEDPDLDVSAVETAFGGGKGLVTSSGGAAGDKQIILKVVETYEPTNNSAASLADDQKKRAASALSDDLLDQLVAKLQLAFPVTINQPLIERAITN